MSAPDPAAVLHQLTEHGSPTDRSLLVDFQPLDDEARLFQCARREAERFGQHDPFDLPRPRRALVVGDHRVHQRGSMLSHHGGRGMDVTR